MAKRKTKSSTTRTARRAGGGKSSHVRTSRKWSARVMQQSNAMDLEAGVFKLKSSAAVARSLKKSAEASHRRKSPPFRSAMSMLNFEINRGGKNLSKDRRAVLEGAKRELRTLFGRPER